MGTVLVKLMKPLPELFGFKEDTPCCVLGQEAGDGDTVESLLRQLSTTHSGFSAITFGFNSQTGDMMDFEMQVNGRSARMDTGLHAGDEVAVSLGGG
ncbi:MAG: hypothetical protein WC749_11455 [Dehalococcoidia bacterium]